MKTFISTIAIFVLIYTSNCYSQATARIVPGTNRKGSKLFHDRHQFTPDKVSFHEKAKPGAAFPELKKLFQMNFIKYYVDEKQGRVYHLSSVPQELLLLPMHKHVQYQGKHQVNFNDTLYKQAGIAMCVSEILDPTKVVIPHQEALSLKPAYFLGAKQGQ
jgi:hypothetical protein